VLSGVLAGTVVDRALVGGPAWHALGAEAWAQFSRQADLGTGLIACPVEAIGTTLLLIAAAVSRRFDGDDRAGAALPLVAAIVLSLLGLLLTMKAAPIMLSLAAVQQAGTLQLPSTIFSSGGFICAALYAFWHLSPRSGHWPVIHRNLSRARSEAREIGKETIYTRKSRRVDTNLHSPCTHQ
jgi:hypothetical protein